MFLLLEFDFIIVLSMYYIHLIIIKRMINITLVLLPRSHHTALTSNYSHISHTHCHNLLDLHEGNPVHNQFQLHMQIDSQNQVCIQFHMSNQSCKHFDNLDIHLSHTMIYIVLHIHYYNDRLLNCSVNSDIQILWILPTVHQ